MRRTPLLLLILCCTTLVAQTDFRSKETSANSIIKKSEITGFTPKALSLLQRSLKQPVRFCQRSKNNSLPDDKAEIILEAHDVWGHGTMGYQMLLDADHNTYGDRFDASTTYYRYKEYDAFEYKIPADAEADELTKTVIIDGEGKVEIPEGVYDYVVTNPIPGDGIPIANGKFSRFDDFYFEGGYTYRFKITLAQSEYGVTDAVNIFADTDAGIVDLTLPGNSMELTSAEEIGITIANNGISAISGFNVSYEVNGGKPVTEIYSGTVQPGDTIPYMFNQKADFSAEQTYIVKAFVGLKGDLVPYNDAIEKRCKHIGVSPLPFTCDFSSAEDFESGWTVINADGNFNTWQYGADWQGPDQQMGTVTCSTYEGNVDDYLLSPPIHLDKGENHIAFYVRGVQAKNEELLDVRYGKTMDCEKMDIINEYAIKDSEFRLKVTNFTVAESGTYYFAFHAKSVKGTNLIVDDITIDQGTMNLSPELLIDKILLPYSNCDLSDETRIGVILNNTGTGDATSFTLAYQINGATPVMQTIHETLPADQSQTYYFDVPANFLDIDKYTVTVAVSCEEKSDSKTDYVEHYAPITKFPFVTDFYLNTGITDYWTPMTEKSWNYERLGGCYSAQKAGPENGLLSRCFTFNHSFRIKIAYAGGIFGTPASFYIAYGKPGTQIDTWKKIYENTRILETVETEFTVELETPGEYSFVIVNTTEDPIATIKLYQFTLSEILDYDLRITEVSTALSAYMPGNHLLNEGAYSVNIVNRGSKTMTGIKAYIKNGQEDLFSSVQTTSLDPSAADTLLLKGKLGAIETIGNMQLNVEVHGDESDMYAVDNVYPLPSVHVTDTVFATERITAFVYGTGLNGTTANFGNVYTLTETDTLTSLSVGMAENNYYTPVDMGIAVYKMKDNGLVIDREIFSTTFERGAQGALREITFAPRILHPGKYYFEVRQLTGENIGLAYERVEESFFYQNIQDTLHLMSGYGNIVIRANFGHNAKAYKTNASAREITTPIEPKALFTSEETVSAVIENLGEEPINDMDVYCAVNGIKKSIKMSLLPYEKKVAVFTPIDLSEPGEYTIQVYTSLEGDENKADDMSTRIFTSVPEADPYTLDFESCNDFVTDHQFNPRWWTVDRLGYGTNGWWQFNYPHNSEPVGFIAFNTATTTPPIEQKIPGFFAHAGERFGAAFATSERNIDSDVWLISPKLTLSTHSSLELYVKTFALESPYSQLERYNLLISDTDDNFESFRKLGEERTAPTEWTKVTADLSEYNNKEVYVAIQYVSKSLEGVVMMVDDIRIISDGVGVRNATAGNLHLWVNQNEKMLSISSEEPIEEIAIYKASGSKVYQSGDLKTSSLRLPLHAYEPGVYIACLRTATQTKVVKFVVTH